MSYVKHILLPDEQILYDGHVHPKVLVPGMLMLAFSAFILHMAAHTGSANSWLLRFTYFLAEHFKAASGLYTMLANWQNASPDISIEIKILALVTALFGFARFMQGVVMMQSIELIVTDRRIIAKYGIMAITTIEMDRNRVSGVMVDQSLWGRIMGYGHIVIQGFTSSIGGLPVMVNPHLLERFVNAGR